MSEKQTKDITCPICKSSCAHLGTVDFNRGCIKAGPPSKVPVMYYLCDSCRFCFAPMFQKWSKSEFLSRIYNEQYVEFDPEYVSVRPIRDAQNLMCSFVDIDKSKIKHLDFGCGCGVLSSVLIDSGWDSTTYDPLNSSKKPTKKFNLITAFEVFEHVSDVHGLMRNLSSLLSSDGVVLFTTAISDKSVIAPGKPLRWWYIGPRNGHISLFSEESLHLLASKHGFRFARLSEIHHALYREDLPLWMSTYRRRIV